MKNKLNLEEYLGQINAYKLTFLKDSITGRLIEQNGNYLRIKTRNGNVIVAHIDTLLSIWHIRQPKAVV
jgi:hypothetical protein